MFYYSKSLTKQTMKLKIIWKSMLKFGNWEWSLIPSNVYTKCFHAILLLQISYHSPKVHINHLSNHCEGYNSNGFQIIILKNTHTKENSNYLCFQLSSYVFPPVSRFYLSSPHTSKCPSTPSKFEVIISPTNYLWY